MKPLIRPTLFMIARLGLFLSVVAWVASQCWQLQVKVGCMGYCAVVGGFRDGFSGWVRPGVFEWTAQATPYPDGPVDFRVASFIDFLKMSPAISIRNCVPGLLTAVHHDPLFPACGFIAQYWLIVTIFALFNVLLMWIYRKRDSPAAPISAVDG